MWVQPVGPQLGVDEAFSQQHTVRHELYNRLTVQNMRVRGSAASKVKDGKQNGKTVAKLRAATCGVVKSSKRMV